MELEILDEVLNFLNTGNINLKHVSPISNYNKLSHKAIIPKDDKYGFYMFHNDLLKKMKSILKPFGLTCESFGIYDNKNALVPSRMFTIVISKGKMNDEDYTVAVVKVMNEYQGNQLTPILNSLNKKIKVTDANYCYTRAYKIYSIDINYQKN